MSISRRQIRLLLLAAFIIGFAAVPVFANLLQTGAPATGTVPVNSPGSGPNIDVVDAGNMTLNTGTWPNNQTVVVETDFGNATFKASNDVNATVHATNITGTYTRVSGLNVSSTDLFINPEDKPAVNVSGDLKRIEFRNVKPDNGKVDFIYAGVSGTTTVTLRGLDANKQYRAVDADGTVLDIATTDGSGTITFNAMPNSEHQVSVKSGSATPVLDNPRPDGNLSTNPSELSVDVTDDDFPGDNVTLTFKIDGTPVETVYATSDGRYATQNISSVQPGQNDWSVIATDENGNIAVINATFGTPGQLVIRNETNASEIIDGPVDVTVRFENGTVIKQRSVNDGTVNLSGIGTGGFIVDINPSQDYYSRTIYYPNLVGNSTAYLLNKSIGSVESRFVLDDPSGQFPSESFVIIKKAINKSGTIQYRTIHSDRFGVEGVTVQLQSGARYQIYVRSPDGTVQGVGPYRADVSETVTVRPGTPSISLGDYEQGWVAGATISNKTLEYVYDDPENATTKVKVHIYEKGNRSNILQPNVTYYSVGNVSASVALSANQSDTTWVVEYHVNRKDQNYVIRKEASNTANLVPTNLAREWRLAFGIGMLLISAGAFSVLNRGVGAVVIALEGGILWYIGFLDGATTGAGVVMALFVAVLTQAYTSRTP